MNHKSANTVTSRLYNLPINTKTSLLAWVSIGGLAFIIFVGGIILRNSLKSKLQEQVESQIAVTDIQYNIKINQMGFGFRGQSDNKAIIDAATKSKNKEQIPADLWRQIRGILQNEIKARNIEYATLVSKDKTIIVNANQTRTGQSFDPNGLVSKALKSGKQIKSTELVNWNDISQEKPPLPEGLQVEEALIRYTVTPVRDASGKEIIGALISGDIVNGKLPIVQKSVDAFTDQDGYSAVYLRNTQGEYQLATSFLETPEEEVNTFVTLEEQDILQKASSNLGEIVTSKSNSKIQGQNYIVAAKAIPNDQGEATAIIVYGSVASSSVLFNSLLTQTILAIFVVAIIVSLTRILIRAIAEPIQELQEVAQNFSEGMMDARAQVYSSDEIGLLASTFNVLADSIETNEARLRDDAKRSRVLKEIALNIGEASDLQEIYNTMVAKAREAIGCDRAIFYTFDKNWQGQVVAESMTEGFQSTLGVDLYNSYFTEEQIAQYQQNIAETRNDIESSNLKDSALAQLRSFKVKSQLLSPVIQGDSLIGLLIVHHCRESKIWQEDDVSFIEQIATQSGNALERINLVEQQQQAQEKERKAKENLQHRALELLMEVDPVSDGDLTIRAQVKEDEIGTIADSYNATIESLRKLVTQVKTSATLVSETTSEKEVFIQDLSTGATQQTQEIGNAIARINAMADSIQQVATNAQQAEQAVRQASDTVKEGDLAMNRTVEGFKAIRETVAETAKKVKRLGESSQKISKVVNLIGSFADQTNLLALNASIEAAHAGEEGRGFAVVADEVRSLARQSAEATAEIESLVAEIQSETNEVVAAMESGTEQVVAGTKLVDETRSSLTQIADVSSQIDDLVRAIAMATVEQSQDSAVVTKTMTQVADISQKTATEAEEVSDSFKELLTVAHKLQESVAKFKVS